MPSNYNCSKCGKTPTEAAIHRTSPKGQDFEGMCAGCLGAPRPGATLGERLADAFTPIDPRSGSGIDG